MMKSLFLVLFMLIGAGLCGDICDAADKKDATACSKIKQTQCTWIAAAEDCTSDPCDAADGKSNTECAKITNCYWVNEGNKRDCTSDPCDKADGKPAQACAAVKKANGDACYYIADGQDCTSDECDKADGKGKQACVAVPNCIYITAGDFNDCTSKKTSAHESYYDMMADYYYDVEIEKAREERAYRLLNEERRNAQKYAY